MGAVPGDSDPKAPFPRVPLGAPRVPALVLFGVFLVAGATLGVEILLTRILALMMWHHLTYVVIGIALVGFGAAGSASTVLRAFRRKPQPVERRMARATLWLAVSLPLCTMAANAVRIDANQLVAEPVNLVALLLLYLLIVVPFFFGGLAICDAISGYPGQVGRVYFADLVGAGVGAVAAVGLIETLTAPGAIIGASAVCALAAACFALAVPGQGLLRRCLGAATPIAVMLVIGLWLLPAARRGHLDPPLAPDKELAVGLANAAGAEGIEVERWNPLARIDVSQTLVAPLLNMGGRFAAGHPPVELRMLFQDGTAPSVYVSWDGQPEGLERFDGASAAIGYEALRERGIDDPEALAIGIGGGPDLLIGLRHGVKSIVGAEINSSTVDLLTNTFSEFTGGLVADERVDLVNAEGRHFARSSEREFDLIQLSGVDTYTALANGAYTLSESYLYTFEAVEEFLGALKPGGVLSYSRIVFPDKPRETLRLAMTAIEVLESQGVAQPSDHVFIMHGGPWASLLISKSAFTGAELDALRTFVETYDYRTLFDPQAPGDGAFGRGLMADASGRETFFEEYEYNVRPALDDRPFFFNYFKWSGLLNWERIRGHAYFIDYPMGHAALVASLVQALLLALGFILWPLFATREQRAEGRSPGVWRATTALTYFFALGAGFIAVEVALMQQLALFLGHPTLSLVTVLPTLLIGGGLGSLSVGPATDPRRRLRVALFLIPLAVVVSAFAGTILDPLLGQSLPVRLAATATLLLPIGFTLGQAFPCGVRVLEERFPAFVPWAWAVNAFATVLGSTGTVLIAMELGFQTTLFFVAPLYAVGVLALLLGHRRLREAGVGTDLEGATPANPAG